MRRSQTLLRTIALRAFREGDSPTFVDAEGCATRLLRGRANREVLSVGWQLSE